MSNWAERVLQAPKRSLGPNVLEILGDGVIGTCVSSVILEWFRAHEPVHLAQLPRLEPWSVAKGIKSVFDSLVSNRGFAHVCQDIGMDALLRWEKPTPPVAHRSRLDKNGVDSITGLGVNTEINAMAAAYEAVAGAVYLDGGFSAASSFVSTTLLKDPGVVQRANAGVKEYQSMITDVVSRWIGVPTDDVIDVGECNGQEGIARSPVQRVQCGVVDLEVDLGPDETRPASPLFYAAVVLRPMRAAAEPLNEQDLVSVSSHFSREMARIAAFQQALEALEGSRQEVKAQGHLCFTPKHCTVGVNGNDVLDGSRVVVRLGKASGKWHRDGDYGHFTALLERFCVPGLRGLAEAGTGNRKDLRQEVRRLHEERSGRRGSPGGTEDSEMNGRAASLYGSGWMVVPRDSAGRGRGRQEWGNGVGSGVICEETVGECLERGVCAQRGSVFHQTHNGLLSEPATAREVCDAIARSISGLSNVNRWWQIRELRGLQLVGLNAYRLWSVQRSIREVSQDRCEVVQASERRMAGAGAVERGMISGDGLDGVDGLRVRRGFVALGVAVEQFGTSTALAWLSGAEERAAAGAGGGARGGA